MFVAERGFDAKTNEISNQVFIKFIENLAQNGESIAESIRMKTETMRSDCRKQKRVLMKREEMSSCLRPIDFELAMIGKRKLQKMNEELQKRHQDFRDDVRSVSLSKNEKQKKLYQAKLDFNELELKSNYYGSSSEKKKLERKNQKLISKC